jgi:hypothetical protein
MNMTIRPGRDYAALRKFRRIQRWNQIKWSLLSWAGFAAYCLVLGLVAFAFYVLAVCLMA